MIGIGLAVAACVAAGLLIARRRRRRIASLRAEYDWSVVGRLGIRTTFSCGDEKPRVTDFVLRTGSVALYYRRSVPRSDAATVPCGDCLLKTLKTSPPVEAVRAHALKPLRTLYS